MRFLVAFGDEQRVTVGARVVGVTDIQRRDLARPDKKPVPIPAWVTFVAYGVLTVQVIVSAIANRYMLIAQKASKQSHAMLDTSSATLTEMEKITKQLQTTLEQVNTVLAEAQHDNDAAKRLQEQAKATYEVVEAAQHQMKHLSEKLDERERS